QVRGAREQKGGARARRARVRHHAWDDVDGRHPEAHLGERARRAAVPAADVEHAKSRPRKVPAHERLFARGETDPEILAVVSLAAERQDVRGPFGREIETGPWPRHALPLSRPIWTLALIISAQRPVARSPASPEPLPDRPPASGLARPW